MAPSSTVLSDAFVKIATDTLTGGWMPHVPEVKQLPVDRHWLPDEGSATTPPARFSSRHPDMWFAFTDVRTRKAPRRRPSKSWWPGVVQSGLMQRSMMTTGSLEFMGIQAVELDPHVTAIMEQPIRLRYELNCKYRFYTPDLYVERIWDKGFIEFKHEEHAELELEQRGFVAKGAALAAAGYFYTVLTERHVACEPLATNLKLVQRASHQRANKVQVNVVRGFLAHHGTAPLDEVRRVAELSFDQVLFLLFHCVVGADMWTTPLDGDTPLSLRTIAHERRPDGRLVLPWLRSC